MTEYSDSDFRLFFEEIHSAAAEFSTAFAATHLFLNLSFFPPLRILSHLNFFKQWVMSIFCKFCVVNSYKFILNFIGNRVIFYMLYRQNIAYVVKFLSRLSRISSENWKIAEKSILSCLIMN